MSFLKKISFVLLIILMLALSACSPPSSSDSDSGNANGVITEPHLHALLEYDEREPNCTRNGYIHHYKCELCGKAFADELAMTDITGTEIIYTSGHQMDGNKCTVCDLSVTGDLFFRGYRNSSTGEFQYAVVSGMGESRAEHVIVPSYLMRDNVKIPLERIDTGAFLNVSGVKSIFIPKSVKSIYQNAFKGCTDLEVVIFEDASACSSVAASIFENCPKLEYVNFGNSNSIKFLGNSTFKNCTRLSKIDFGENSGLEEVPMYCFDSCVSLSSIELPVGIKKVYDKAFSKCCNITSLVFNDNLTAIGNLAFEKCTSLTELVIGNSVTEIGNYAFSKCSALESLFIPDSVKKIGNEALSGCEKLTVTLGQGVNTKNFNSKWNSEGRPVKTEE